MHLEEVEAGVVAGALAGQRVYCDGRHVALRRVDHPDAEREVRVAARVIGRRDAPRPACALNVPVAAAACRHHSHTSSVSVQFSWTLLTV